MPDHSTLDSQILGQTAEALIFADPQGHIRRWNLAAVAMFGFPSDEALGQSLDLIIPERLRDAHWRAFDKAIAAGHTASGPKARVTRCLHKDGLKLYVEMSFALVLDDAGTVLGSVAVARDVTERVEQEKAERAKAAAPRQDVPR